MTNIAQKFNGKSSSVSIVCFQTFNCETVTFILMSGRGEKGCMYGVSLLEKRLFFEKELLDYTTPCLRNSLPLSPTILLAERFSFPTHTEIWKLGHISGRLHKLF